ncbi:MAG: L,D-transpeptidase family protein [Pseudomonadota bacterium]
MSIALFTATSRGKFSGGPLTCRCAVGRGGVQPADQKREGDGASPMGVWPMRRVFYRPDRLRRPETALPCIPIQPQDGWCDDPDHALYNRPVSLPFGASHEVMWRDDHIYDLLVELGHNDDPVVPKLGSAVFLHLSRTDFSPTRGCVAIELPDLLTAVAMSGPGTALEISY